MSSPPIDHPRLAQLVEALPDADLHALPYGAVHLDAQGTVRFFSDSEARLSGYGAREALGRSFFTDVAPCFGAAGYLDRIARARASGTLDLEFGHVGDFGDTARELRVRIVSAKDGGVWIFTQRL
jgi:photoactive yellow protein